jgi:hypothetical protein
MGKSVSQDLEPTAADRLQFARLSGQWKAETQFSSSSDEITSHPAYQAILSMGSAAVPLILQELEREPNHWFAALKAITHADPVPLRSRGRMTEMAEAWVKWGRANGIRW